MARVSREHREVTYKIVYYGTGLGGKTTNIKYIYNQLAPAVRGELVSVATETERTLFFDFLPVDLGTIQGYHARMAIYTVPGQAEYNQSRRVILQGVDGIVFVADSSELKAVENVESLKNMIDNLSEYRTELNSLPWVLQYNKRDLEDAMPVDVMDRTLNTHGVPSFESVAFEGKGVMETFKELTRLVLKSI